MNQQKIVLFMKGDRTAPRCGFSRKIVALLESQNVTDYATFDILKDESVRQGECYSLRFCLNMMY
jgi:glutaredoxin-related protein